MTHSAPAPAVIDPSDPVLRTGPAGPGGGLNVRLGARVAGGLLALLLLSGGLTLALRPAGEGAKAG